MSDTERPYIYAEGTGTLIPFDECVVLMLTDEEAETLLDGLS